MNHAERAEQFILQVNQINPTHAQVTALNHTAHLIEESETAEQNPETQLTRAHLLEAAANGTNVLVLIYAATQAIFDETAQTVTNLATEFDGTGPNHFGDEYWSDSEFPHQRADGYSFTDEDVSPENN